MTPKLTQKDVEAIETALKKSRTGDVSLKVEQGKINVFVVEKKKVSA